ELMTVPMIVAPPLSAPELVTLPLIVPLPLSVPALTMLPLIVPLTPKVAALLTVVLPVSEPLTANPPPDTVTPPGNVAVPDSVRVPVPILVREAPVPPKEPDRPVIVPLTVVDRLLLPTVSAAPLPRLARPIR